MCFVHNPTWVQPVVWTQLETPARGACKWSGTPLNQWFDLKSLNHYFQKNKSNQIIFFSKKVKSNQIICQKTKGVKSNQIKSLILNQWFKIIFEKVLNWVEKKLRIHRLKMLKNVDKWGWKRWNMLNEGENVEKMRLNKCSRVWKCRTNIVFFWKHHKII